jgi:hypothetical protein
MDEILHDREQQKNKPAEEQPAAREELRIA